jgi:predicted N-formylglutamate amidohydrolase
MAIDATAGAQEGFTRLLRSQDPVPVVVQNEGARTPYLIVCDHAGRAVPASLGALGLPAAEFDRHIAWDIGAANLAVALANRLEAFLIRQTYSRLVVDCNRSPDRDDLIVTEADGARVFANEDLAPEALEARLAEIHQPYHSRIQAEVDGRLAGGRPPSIISVHSFTPTFQGYVRPWHVGVLHDGASRSSHALLRLLRAEPDLVAGDNEPYAMDNVDYTIPRHAIARGLQYLEIEVRQDLICDQAGVARYADLLARLIPLALVG